VVLGRADGLRRVFVNLLDNAFKHGTPPVSVTIGTSEGVVAVAVRDRGPGIPAEDRERVFERFTRLDANRQVPGIGLGLAIVQGIAVGYGGKVWISEPADGEGGAVMNVALQPA
jgi:signal transduction histidine kinase